MKASKLFIAGVCIALTGCATTKRVVVENPQYRYCSRQLNDPAFRSAEAGGHGAIAYSMQSNLCWWNASKAWNAADVSVAGVALRRCRDSGAKDCAVYSMDDVVLPPRYITQTVRSGGVTGDDVANIIAIAAAGYGASQAAKASYPAYKPVQAAPTPSVYRSTAQSVVPIVATTPISPPSVTMSSPGCISDTQCGAGMVCARANGQIGVMGRCVQPVTNAGVPIFAAQTTGQTLVASCSYDVDCSAGFHCVRKNVELKGLCTR